MTVKLWPYIRGVYSKDVLYRLWRVVEESGAGPSLCWGQHDPEPMRHDLPSFVRFAEDPGRHLFLLTNDDGKEIVGCLWFDDIIPNYRCFGSIFMRPSHRGDESLEAMRLGLAYAFGPLHMQQVWGITPWNAAKQLCLAVGFAEVAVLPGFAWVHGRPQDVTVLRLIKETYGERLS